MAGLPHLHWRTCPSALKRRAIGTWSLQLLYAVAGFEGLERVPSMFVLMGSFQSFSCNAATTDYAAIKANFTALAQLISEFTRITVRDTLRRLPPALPHLHVACALTQSHHSTSQERAPGVLVMWSTPAKMLLAASAWLPRGGHGAVSHDPR